MLICHDTTGRRTETPPTRPRASRDAVCCCLRVLVPHARPGPVIANPASFSRSSHLFFSSTSCVPATDGKGTKGREKNESKCYDRSSSPRSLLPLIFPEFMRRAISSSFVTFSSVGTTNPKSLNVFLSCCRFMVSRSSTKYLSRLGSLSAAAAAAVPMLISWPLPPAVVSPRSTPLTPRVVDSGTTSTLSEQQRIASTNSRFSMKPRASTSRVASIAFSSLAVIRFNSDALYRAFRAVCLRFFSNSVSLVCSSNRHTGQVHCFPSQSLIHSRQNMWPHGNFAAVPESCWSSKQMMQFRFSSRARSRFVMTTSGKFAIAFFDAGGM
mmetsp:Transcript_3282/g.7720  ORF Transcript_3282/g.7720 Transcript_3282/m.7720 type:complete len:325 (-) Transcript_3282:567-1541(-)